MLASGIEIEEILEDLPELSVEDVRDVYKIYFLIIEQGRNL